MVASRVLWTLLLILRLSLSGALRHSKVKGVSKVATAAEVRILKKYDGDDDNIMNAKEKDSIYDSLSPSDEYTSPPEEDDEVDTSPPGAPGTSPPGAPGTQAPAPTDAPADAPADEPADEPAVEPADEPDDESNEPDDGSDGEVDEPEVESYAPSAETDVPVDPRDEEDDEFARYLYPFVVTIEGKNITSALGIPTCLLEEMAEDLANIEDIVIETFALINTGLADDSESSMYSFNLEFGGYASFLGSPLHTTEFVQEIQGNVLNDIGFLQECIDSEAMDMELRVTAIEGEPETDDEDIDEDDDDMMRIWYLVGLAGGAMFLSCCLIIITSMVKTGDDK